MLMSVIL